MYWRFKSRNQPLQSRSFITGGRADSSSSSLSLSLLGESWCFNLSSGPVQFLEFIIGWNRITSLASSIFCSLFAKGVKNKIKVGYFKIG